MDEHSANGVLTRPTEELAMAAEDTAAVHSGVDEIKQAVGMAASGELTLTEKVEALRGSLESISAEVQSWSSRRKDSYLEALDGLKSQVEEIELEWDTLSTTLTAQREKLESLLQSFPGVIETSALRALALRVTHLEQLVAQLVDESRDQTSSSRARKQLVLSFVALGVTIVLWGAWLGIAAFRG